LFKRVLFVSCILFLGIVIGIIFFSSTLANIENDDLALVKVEYPVNKSGQTYGSSADARSYEEEPDLISAIGEGNIEGYVKKEDLQQPTPENPEEAIAMMENEESKEIPLYDVDGETIIGTFTIEVGESVEVVEYVE
jgi:hypothetical protein